MRRILALGLALVACACSTDAAITENHRAPTLSKSGAEQLMFRADEVKRLALEGMLTARLTDTFRGRALKMLEAQAQGVHLRGFRMEERDSDHALVFWDPRTDEGVLEVVAQRRLVTQDQPNPAWAATVRQWWAQLQYADGSWWVMDQRDLSPDQWYRLTR